jgi:Protein of unknown function (DUF1573)
MLRYLIVPLFALFLTTPTRAQSWADQLFEEQSKDFGAVARGQVLMHPFRVTNNTNRPVHIASIRVSCGCVHAAALRDRLAPGESTAIQADMDTRRFHGVRRVTIFVQFDQPDWEEARLSVQADSHDDLFSEPDGFAFGKMKRGTKPSAVVNLSVLGAGWRITGTDAGTQYVQPSIKDMGSGRYQITASLRDDTPAGYWYTEVWLKTDNPAVARVRLPVTVDVTQ